MDSPRLKTVSIVTSQGAVKLTQTHPRRLPLVEKFTLSERLEALREMTVQTKQEAEEQRTIERLLSEDRG